jgi:hypothetical protein
LKILFGTRFEDDILEEYLRKEGGNVDKCVQSLYALNDKEENESAFPPLAPLGAPPPPPPSHSFFSSLISFVKPNHKPSKVNTSTTPSKLGNSTPPALPFAISTKPSLNVVKKNANDFPPEVWLTDPR